MASAPIALDAASASGARVGPISLADGSATTDPFAELVGETAGEEASAIDVLGQSADDESDPISALAMLAGEEEQDEQPPDEPEHETQPPPARMAAR